VLSSRRFKFNREFTERHDQGFVRVRIAGIGIMVNGHWLCVHAGPDSEAAVTYAKGQIRHDGSSAVTRAEVRALSDDGVAVIWESQ
jgi:hypothetical protein